MTEKRWVDGAWRERAEEAERRLRDAVCVLRQIADREDAAASLARGGRSRDRELAEKCLERLGGPTAR